MGEAVSQPFERTDQAKVPTDEEVVHVCRQCGWTRFGFDTGVTGWNGDKIPLFQVTMSPDAPAAVAAVLRSGYIGEGEVVKKLERKIGEAVNAVASEARVLCTNSCTSALELALDALGIGPGDAVISTPMTCLATNAPLRRRGARIYWADVCLEDGTISVPSIQGILDQVSDIKAIVAVDYGGKECDLAGLRKFGKPIILDAAHRFPGGPLADFTCFSFQAIKHLTTGDGGALVVKKPWDEDARLLRWFGLDRDRDATFRAAQKPSLPGGKFHMTNIAAAIGLTNWSLAQVCVVRSLDNAARYSDGIKAVERVLYLPPPNNHAWLYPLLVSDRDRFIGYLARHGIEASPSHCRNDDAPVHKDAQALFPLTGVNFFDSHQVCIPVGHWVTPDQIDYIIELINRQGW